MSDIAAEKTYEVITAGESASFTVKITPELIHEFAEVSGDRNPLHVDDSYARATSFGQRVSHGMIVGALFSRLIGMYLPGKYSVYLSQTLNFHKPVFVGAEVVIKGEVIHKTDSARSIVIRTIAEDARSGEMMVDGEAMVRLLK
ncbi:MAG TPA: MaoC family dehydratase [Candidatus Paceibacterota bacterium]|nr:MaoC family dehydratase [Candidatus Paceibacterota bacterium]